MSSVVEEVKSDLRVLISKTHGLNSIVITDNCGVPLISVSKESSLSSSGHDELHSRPSIMSSFSHGAEQAHKLGIGGCKTMTCLYDHQQIVHFNKAPLVVALIASIKANTGLLLALEHDFDPICSELKKCVQDN